MALYLIGIGLGGKEDITVRGLGAIKACDEVYLERYTSLFGSSADELSSFYGKDVKIADRTLIESGADKEIIEKAKIKDIAIIVIGDVFSATTHTDLMLRARKAGVTVEYIPNASIFNVIGITGLELYKFGKTTSIPFPTGSFVSETCYDVIKQNLAQGLHTLCLLDIKVAEPSPENLRKGIDTPEPPRFMTVKDAIKTLMAVERKRGENLLSEKTMAVGCARMGAKDFVVKYGDLAALKKEPFGDPLHSLIIPGNMHFIEEEALAFWKVDQ